MDIEKIGKFIAERRKKNNLTQEQLAEKLGLTKNAVSRWERGLGLMDMSLLRPLSEVLNVSVNEILAGEKISKENLEDKTEENIINLVELIDLKTMRTGIIAMALFFMVLVLISNYKEISPAPLVSLICVYNSVTFLSRYKIRKDRTDLFSGVLFLIAVILNTINFIIS